MNFSVAISEGICQPSVLSEKLPAATPTSPNVAAFEQFGNIPVGLYSGIPNISLPIYNIKVNNYDLPINLSYHASGIKVDQIASSEGLGWSLMAGGTISVTHRGGPDEINGYLANDRDLERRINQHNKNEMTSAEKNSLYYEIAFLGADSQPDVYNYNFCGLSGKFMIDTNYNMVPIPYENIKISRVGGNFVVTDSKGIKYYFNDQEHTQSISHTSPSSPLDPLNYISTWHLSKIELTNGQEIIFNYSVTTINQDYNISESKYFLVPGTYGPDCWGNMSFPPVIDYSSWTETQVHQKKLSSIFFASGKIEFTYDPSQRTDLPGDYALSKIEIFNRVGSNVYSLIDKFVLNHSYTSNRLFLESLTEYGSGQMPKSHSFIYKQGSLPAIKSKSIDYWGYYNGKINSTLIPKSYSREPFFVNGADRSPNPTLMMNGTLEKIVYPTKGYTIFEFEPHDYGNVYTTGEDILDSIYQDVTKSAFVNALATGTESTSSFIITFTQEVYVQTRVLGSGIYVRLTGPSPSAGARFGDFGTAADATLKEKEGWVTLTPGTYTLRAFNYENEFVADISVSYKEKMFLGLAKNRVAGGLRIKSLKNYSNDNALTGSKLFTYRLGSEPDRSSGTLASQFYNEYYKWRYIEVHCGSDIGSLQGNQWLEATYLVRSSYSSLPSALSNGSPVDYSEVSVTEDQNGVKGKSVSEFESLNDHGDLVFIDFPVGLAVDYDYLRGHLKSKIDFKYENGNFVKIKSTKNKYLNLGDAFSGLPGLIVGNETYDNSFPANNTYSSHIYNLFTSKFRLVETADTLFYGNDLIVTNKKLNYNNEQHNYPTSEISTTSDGKQILNQYVYPQDFASGTVFIDDMIAENNVQLPIEQVAYNIQGGNYKILSGTVNEFFPGGKGLVSDIYKLENSDPLNINQFKFSNAALGTFPDYTSNNNYSKDSHLSLRLKILSYDSYGNPVYMKQESGAGIVYLYSYAGQYPIAEIKNADYTSVEAVLGGATAIQNFSNQINPDKPTIDNLIAPLKTALPKALITTYTYKPLVGTTSQTDIKGITTYYEYDSFQRLMYIKDKDGNIIKDYTYHYKP